MTEDEAKTKWCPYARISSLNEGGDDGPSSNRWLGWISDGEVGSVACCIASTCMAWRWSEAEHARRFVSAFGGAGVNFVTTERAIKPDERQGYCGLAGQP